MAHVPFIIAYTSNEFLSNSIGNVTTILQGIQKSRDPGVGLASLLKPIFSVVDPIYTGTAQVPGKLISDIIIHWPEAKIAAVATENGYQAYRYYFDTVFPNTQRFLGERAYHTSKIPEVSTPHSSTQLLY